VLWVFVLTAILNGVGDQTAQAVVDGASLLADEHGRYHSLDGATQQNSNRRATDQTAVGTKSMKLTTGALHNAAVGPSSASLSPFSSNMVKKIWFRSLAIAAPLLTRWAVLKREAAIGLNQRNRTHE
jgi:hypothetical protein